MERKNGSSVLEHNLAALAELLLEFVPELILEVLEVLLGFHLVYFKHHAVQTRCSLCYSGTL